MRAVHKRSVSGNALRKYAAHHIHVIPAYNSSAGTVFCYFWVHSVRIRGNCNPAGLPYFFSVFVYPLGVNTFRERALTSVIPCYYGAPAVIGNCLHTHSCRVFSKCNYVPFRNAGSVYLPRMHAERLLYKFFCVPGNNGVSAAVIYYFRVNAVRPVAYRYSFGIPQN